MPSAEAHGFGGGLFVSPLVNGVGRREERRDPVHDRNPGGTGESGLGEAWFGYDLNNGWHGEPGAQNGSNMWGATPLYFTLNQNLNPVYPTIGAPIRGSRDLLRNGGMQTWDISLFKNLPLGSNQERYLQLRLEAFNVFNHPNFNDKIYGFDDNGPYQWQPGTPFSISRIPNWGANADTYGSGPGGFRVLQLGAKIYF